MALKSKQIKRGFALIDTVVAIGLIGLSLAVLAGVYPARRLSQMSRAYVIAQAVAQTKMEELRLLGFAALNSSQNTVFTDSNLNKLKDAAGAYAVTEFDADNDGQNEDDIKKITVTVTWSERGESKIVSLQTLLGQTGLNQ